MHYVKIYTRTGCPWCTRAKELLEQHQLAYSEVNITEAPGRFEEMVRAADGRETTPQVFIDNVHIGGFEDLERYFESSGTEASP